MLTKWSQPSACKGRAGLSLEVLNSFTVNPRRKFTCAADTCQLTRCGRTNGDVTRAECKLVSFPQVVQPKSIWHGWFSRGLLFFGRIGQWKDLFYLQRLINILKVCSWARTSRFLHPIRQTDVLDGVQQRAVVDGSLRDFSKQSATLGFVIIRFINSFWSLKRVCVMNFFFPVTVWSVFTVSKSVLNCLLPTHVCSLLCATQFQYVVWQCGCPQNWQIALAGSMPKATKCRMLLLLDALLLQDNLHLKRLI